MLILEGPIDQTASCCWNPTSCSSLLLNTKHKTHSPGSIESLSLFVRSNLNFLSYRPPHSIPFIFLKSRVSSLNPPIPTIEPLINIIFIFVWWNITPPVTFPSFPQRFPNVFPTKRPFWHSPPPTARRFWRRLPQTPQSQDGPHRSSSHGRCRCRTLGPSPRTDETKMKQTGKKGLKATVLEI